MPKPEINVMIVGTVVGPEPENDADHFYVCPTCHQAVDYRRLDLVFYHDQDGHKPKPLM